MNSNPITGRSHIFTGYPPNENEATNPDPSLTIAVVIFCIVGPFWLIYRLAKHVAKKIVLFTGQTAQKLKEISRA